MTVYNPKAPRSGKKKEFFNPPSNFSLDAFHNVTITLDDETKELLRSIDSTLQRLAGANKSTSQIIEEALSEPIREPRTTEEVEEPAELSGVNEEALKAFEEEKYGHVVSANEIGWNKIPNNDLFDWREEGKTLILRYSGISHDTNWETIRKLLEFSGGRGGTRTKEIIKVIGSKTSKKIVAFRTFCRCIEEGIIKPPSLSPDDELDSMYSKFSQEVDPDEPMLAGLNLTRVKDNCGNGEEAC